MNKYFIYPNRTIKDVNSSLREKIENLTDRKIYDSAFLYDNPDVDFDDNQIIHLTYLDVYISKLSKEQCDELIENDEVLEINKEILFDLRYQEPKEKDFISEDDLKDCWGLNYLKLEKSNLQGDGVNVAVLDTGIDLEHEDFKNLIPKSRRKNFINWRDSVQDGNGHGTHVTGIISGISRKKIRYGVAPNCNLFIGKVLTNSGLLISNCAVINGIDWAIHNKCSIINISAGARVKEKDGINKDFNDAVNRAWDSGAVVIAAVGNDSDSEGPYFEGINTPANCPNAIAVTAINENDVIYFRANKTLYKNQLVKFGSPGVFIKSSYPKSNLNKHGYAILSGTSMSTAFVSGLAALYIQKMNLSSSSKIFNTLKINIIRLGLPLEVIGHGVPVLN